MDKITIRRFGVSSVAKYVGVAHAILGVVYGVLALFAGIIAVAEYDDISRWQKVLAGVGVGVGALVVIPVVAFIVGWLYGAVFTLIVNFILQTSQGIELDVEKDVTPPLPTAAKK